MKNLLMAALLALGVHLGSHAAADPDHFVLTPALLQKIKAAEADLKKQGANGKDGKDDANEDDPSVEDVARKIDRDPKLRAVLARHGLSSMDFALSVHALMHAGMYLAFEKSMDKKKAAALYGGYTREQQANIELLRKSAGAAR